MLFNSFSENKTNAFLSTNQTIKSFDFMPSIYSFTIIFLTIFILGIVFNVISILSILLAKAFTPINILILNLAIADIFYSFGIPLFLINLFSDSWPFGLFGCRLFFLTDFIGMIVGVFSVAALSVERFYDVAHKTKRPEIYSYKFKVIVICFVVFLIWLFAILFSFPMIVSIELVVIPNRTVTSCGSNWSEYTINIFFLLKFLFIFIIPLLVIGFSSVRLLIFLKSWKSKNIKKKIKLTKTRDSVVIYERCSLVNLKKKNIEFSKTTKTSNLNSKENKDMNMNRKKPCSIYVESRYSSTENQESISNKENTKITKKNSTCLNFIQISNKKYFKFCCCFINVKINYSLKNMVDEIFTTKPHSSLTLTIRKKAIRLVLAIVLMFFIQWIPIWIFQLYIALSNNEIKYIRTINIVITIISYLNSVANPALYMLLTYNFKKYCKESFNHLKRFCFS